MNRRGATAIVVLLAASALGGCGGGGGGDGDAALRETVDRLGSIRSGVLDAGLLVTPRNGEPFGFELSGPFQLAAAGKLPRMRVTYTRIVDGRRRAATIVSDGADAWAEVDGSRVALGPEDVADLRGALGGSGNGLGALAIDDWIENADSSDGSNGTEVVAGDLDIVATVNGLLTLVRATGSELRPIEGKAAERLRDATEEATYRVVTGDDDRLLRLLELQARFGFDVPDELRRSLGDVVGATVDFHLGVDDPNKRVQIEEEP